MFFCGSASGIKGVFPDGSVFLWLYVRDKGHFPDRKVILLCNYASLARVPNSSHLGFDHHVNTTYDSIIANFVSSSTNFYCLIFSHFFIVVLHLFRPLQLEVLWYV